MNINNETISLVNVYDGNKMRLFGWTYPVVIDLEGIEIPNGDCVLLIPNGNGGLKREGVHATSVLYNKLWMNTNRDKANGYSIGAEIVVAELVNKGSRCINGHEIEAPFYWASKSVLREVVELENESHLEIKNKSETERKNSKMTNGEKYKTAKERAVAFEKECQNRTNCAGCKLHCKGAFDTWRYFAWLDLETEEETIEDIVEEMKSHELPNDCGGKEHGCGKYYTEELPNRILAALNRINRCQTTVK